MKRKSIHISKLMPLAHEAEPALLDFTVGIIKPVKIPSPPSAEECDAVLVGCGVLVTAEDQYAILTADHVLEALPDSGPIGLVLLGDKSKKDHQFFLEMEHVQKVRIGRGKIPRKGPDLGLIVLPLHKVSILKAVKSFYNLSKRENLVDRYTSSKTGPWIMCGLIGEMTRQLPPLPGTYKRFAFSGLSGPVIVKAERQGRSFDFFTAELNCGELHGLPESYGGYSGSGVWLLNLDEQKGKQILKSVTLGGIAFYQSAVKNGERLIECHGFKSIYKRAVTLLREGPQ